VFEFDLFHVDPEAGTQELYEVGTPLVVVELSLDCILNAGSVPTYTARCAATRGCAIVAPGGRGSESSGE
jgi:hypothetical protein